ncbi:MAG TPA: hypothetical protein VF730_02670 [Terracidiphilus sp.]
MASLYPLRTVLYRIRARLVAHPVFTRGTGVPVNDPSHFEELEELEKLKDQLHLVMRELNNRSNLLEVRSRNLWNVPQKDRFRARASIRSHTDETAEVFALAREVRELLEDLMEKSGRISQGELADGLGKFIEKLHHEGHTHSEVAGNHGLSYSKAQPHEHAGSIEGVTILIFALLQAWVHVNKRKETRKK